MKRYEIFIDFSLPMHLIIRVSDQLAAGEIKLTEYTEEESQAAKAKLEAHRIKRRDRYSSKTSKHFTKKAELFT